MIIYLGEMKESSYLDQDSDDDASETVKLNSASRHMRLSELGASSVRYNTHFSSGLKQESLDLIGLHKTQIDEEKRFDAKSSSMFSEELLTPYQSSSKAAMNERNTWSLAGLRKGLRGEFRDSGEPILNQVIVRQDHTSINNAHVSTEKLRPHKGTAYNPSKEDFDRARKLLFSAKKANSK
jgi:hypothetical protein